MDEGHDGTISVVEGGGGDEDMYYFTVPATSVAGIEQRDGQLGGSSFTESILTASFPILTSPMFMTLITQGKLSYRS